MSRDSDFARHLTAYLGRHLPGQRNLSPNTIASYSDAFRLLLAYFESAGKRAELLSMGDLDREAVEGFMSWLAGRGCSDSTLNQRLCAVKAFVNYVKGEDPARLLQYQQVLSIRQRKAQPAKMVVPGREGLAAILAHPDGSTRRGRRDMVLLTLLYDSGARVSELCGLRLRDVRLDGPATVTLYGKGRKSRVVPLMRATASLVGRYIEEAYPDAGPAEMDSPLFPSPRGGHLTRAGVADIVARHVKGARGAGAPIPEGVSPHSFRHQKAIDLLESGVNLVYIRDLLGHRSVTTTEIYATVSLARKRELLEAAATAPRTRDYPDWSGDKELMSWLKSLC